MRNITGFYQPCQKCSIRMAGGGRCLECEERQRVFERAKGEIGRIPAPMNVLADLSYDGQLLRLHLKVKNRTDIQDRISWHANENPNSVIARSLERMRDECWKSIAGPTIV
jgi:hypothetical protein